MARQQTKTRKVEVYGTTTRARRWLVIAAKIMADQYQQEAAKCDTLKAESAHRNLTQLSGTASELATRIEDSKTTSVDCVQAQCEIVAEGLRRLKKRLDAIQGTLRGVGWEDKIEGAQADAEQIVATMLPNWDSQLTLEP